MKKIKTYKLFIENSDFDIDITDNSEIKIAKEHLKTIQDQISEFKTKKSNIDNIYSKDITDDELSKEVDNIIGTNDKDRNPFLVEYLHIANLKRKISKLQKNITNDKIRKDDFIEEMTLSDNQSTKQNINAKITDISNRILTNSVQINNINKEINDAQNTLNKKMSDIEKDIVDNIEKISK
jgi:hypothetical protein